MLVCVVLVRFWQLLLFASGIICYWHQLPLALCCSHEALLYSSSYLMTRYCEKSRQTVDASFSSIHPNDLYLYALFWSKLMINVSFARPLNLTSNSFCNSDLYRDADLSITDIVVFIGPFLHRTSDYNDAVYNDCLCVCYLITARCCLLIMLEIYARRTNVCVWAAGSWTTVYNWHCRQFKPG